FTLCIVEPSCFIGSAVDFSQIGQVLLGNDFSIGASQDRSVPRNDPFDVELSHRSKQTLRGSVRLLQRPPNNRVLRSHKIVADEKDALLLDQIRRPVPGMPSGLKGSDRPFTKSHTLGWPDLEINSRLAHKCKPP